mgnify:CR=1 FL=1
MKTKLVVVPNLKRLIHASPGFAKKGLADFKLDVVERASSAAPIAARTPGTSFASTANRSRM